MSFKKDPRFVAVGTGATAFLAFNLDPDIYKGDINTALGVVNVLPTGAGVEKIPYTLKLAKRSSAVGIVKVKIQRGEGDLQETRALELVCDKANLDTAKGALNGKTVNIGPTNELWTIKA